MPLFSGTYYLTNTSLDLPVKPDCNEIDSLIVAAAHNQSDPCQVSSFGLSYCYHFQLIMSSSQWIITAVGKPAKNWYTIVYKTFYAYVRVNAQPPCNVITNSVPQYFHINEVPECPGTFT